MKRLKPGDRFRPVSWPEPAADPFGARGLFEPRHRYRRITVMVDAHLIDSTADDEKTALLRVLLEHELVALVRFADDGPPPDLPAELAPDGTPMHRGWVVLTTWDDGPGVLSETENGGWRLSAIYGNAAEVAASDTRSAAYESLAPPEASARRASDALAAQVASQAVQADLYITERPYLHAATWEIARHTAVCTVTEALALLGLYFRAQEEYLVLRFGHEIRYNRGLFTWVGTRELLPAAWRWLTALSQHDRHLGLEAMPGEESLSGLAESLLLRVERGLAARDDVHIAVNRPQHNDTADDILTALDELLITMVAAFDVTARVAHRVLDLPGSDRTAGWQHQAWLGKVAAKESDLAAIMADGTPGIDCFTVIRVLRNYIHGQALRSVHVQHGGRPGRNLVRLPGAHAPGLLSAMDRQGGRERWGVQPAALGTPFLDPAALADATFESVVPTLNLILDATPVETLGGVQLRPQHCRPPDDEHDTFGLAARRSIRWQYGL